MSTINCLYLTQNDDMSYLHMVQNTFFTDQAMQIEFANVALEDAYYVCEVDAEKYDMLCINHALLQETPPAQAIICWLGILKQGGTLLLQTTDENIALNRLFAASSVMAHIAYWDNHSYRIQKKSYYPPLNNLLYYAQQHEQVGEYFQAAQLYQQAMVCYPKHINAYVHAIILYEKMAWQQACETLYHALLHIFPAHSYLKIMAILLSLGSYYWGMQLREYYYFTHAHIPFSRRTPHPPEGDLINKRWQGKSLNGKTLAIWSEFGLGDEIMFLQLTHHLKQQCGAAKIIVLTQKPLVGLFQTCPDIDQVIEVSQWQQQLPEVDYWEFPYAILSHCPQPFQQLARRNPYLFADKNKIAQFAADCRSDKVRIGIAWRGAPASGHDAIRSVHDTQQLDELLAKLPDGIQIYCLQKDLNDAERAWLKRHQIPEFSARLHDFTDTAGLYSHMDYVISADTSVIHLAGAMGISGIVMITREVDWRWGQTLPDNPWYAHIYRAMGTETWSQTFDLVAQKLREYLSNRAT